MAKVDFVAGRHRRIDPAVEQFLDQRPEMQAGRSIRAGLAGSCAEERSVRLGALALIDDARRRFKPDMPGSFMR
jgi:hypothetical protein